MENQRQADREFGRKKQRIAVQVEPDMAIRPEFGAQQVLDIATGAIDPRDQIVGRRQRADAVVDAVPDLRLIVQHLVQHGMNRRRLVLQPVLQLVDDELAVIFFLDQPFCDFALLRDDRSIVLDAPDRQPQTAQKISSSASARNRPALPKLTVTPSAPAAIAVGIPTRKPPTAVAKNTAGKYGVKNTSGRIWASPQRGVVAKTRQQTAKPMLNGGEGWEIPCQPCLNSSINFVIGVVTSRDQRIQNKAEA